MIKVKRAYDPPLSNDGKRILVDRLWPRGLSKEDAQIDEWTKEIAPSNELRNWFNHDPDKWAEFRKRYFAELAGKRDLLEEIIDEAGEGTITLLFGAREARFNNAVALKEYVDSRMNSAKRKKAA